ncbi:HEAT repeat domain-containing protein [candidate division KSB1 bacterium]|nr:HEAT repeat domain-containing protein [candidate division KSB1 bacterium]
MKLSYGYLWFFLIFLYFFYPTPGLSNITILDNSTRNYDQKHIRLVLRFDFEKEIVFGWANLQVIALEDEFQELVLHSQIDQILSVKSNEQKLKFLQKNGLLYIKLNRLYKANELIQVEIEYQTRPANGLFFSYPTLQEPEIPYQIWSQGQGENNRYWFPCFDSPGDKLTAEIIAKVPGQFQVISNGKLLKVFENPRTKEKTYHWKMDYEQVSYLISIVVGEFNTSSDTLNGIPLNYNIPVDYRPVDVDLIFGRTPAMMSFFSNNIYPYPYEKYDQTPVYDFKHGGMENVSATTLNYRIFHEQQAVPNYSPETLIAHELAHQWFGNLVSVRDWSHFWLHEGFATYFTDLYFENQYGADEFCIRRFEQDRTYLEERDNFPITAIKAKNTPYTPVDFPGRAVYTRGAAILHALRFELGDENFFKGIHHYLQKYQFCSVTSEDFRQAMELASQKDLSQFFRQWVYGAGHPQLSVSWKWIDSTQNMVLNVQQIQPKTEVSDVFHFSVPVEISAGLKKIRVTLPIAQREQQFNYQLPQKPALISFDKGYWIIKELNFPKTFQELQYQVLFDDDMIGRLLAAEQLASFGEKAIPTFEKAYIREQFYAVRIAIIKSLGKIGSPTAFQVLKKTIKDADPRVREVTMQALANFPDAEIVKLLYQQFQSEEKDYVRAEVIKSLSIINPPGNFEFLKEALKINSHNNIIRVKIFEGFIHHKATEALELAREFVSVKYSDGGMHLLEQTVLEYAKTMASTHRNQALEIIFAGIENPSLRVHYIARDLVIKLNAIELLPKLQKLVAVTQRARHKDNIEWIIKKLVNNNDFSAN